MNKFTILGLVLTIVAIVLIISASKDVSTYANFEAASESTKSVRIAGQLSKNKPMQYDPEIDPNLFTFYMKDEDLVERQVKLLMPKPQDIERSEQLVLTGKMDGDVFVAHDILTKCPSKYKDEEIQLRRAG